MARIGRRKFVAALGSTIVVRPFAARAQTAPMRRVGVLMNGAATESVPQSYVAAFVDGLRKLGWTEGQNLRVDLRWNAGDASLARAYAAQLIGLMPDVILASSTTNLEIIRQATSTVPVVFTQISDPVEQGFVASLTKPGGNLTGFSMYEFSIGGKWLDLLKEAAPSLTRVALLFNPETAPQSRFYMRSVEAAAASLNVKAIVAPVHAIGDIETALQGFAGEPNAGLILPTDTFTRLRLSLIADSASRHRLPAIAASPNFPKDGGLMYYGSSNNLIDQYQQAATYVDRILKGAKPGDLPVQQASKFELVINLKVAKALGLTIPLPLLGLADAVIE